MSTPCRVEVKLKSWFECVCRVTGILWRFSWKLCWISLFIASAVWGCTVGGVMFARGCTSWTCSEVSFYDNKIRMVSLFVGWFLIWFVLVFGMNCCKCVWLDIVYSRTDPMASNTNMNTNLRKLQRQRSPNGGSITCRILHHDDDRGRRPRVKRGGCISCLTLQNVYVIVSNCKFYLS